MATSDDKPTAKPSGKPELVDTYVADVAGNISIIRTPKGQKYKAGDPLVEFGTRVATEEQVAAYLAAQGK